MQLEVRLLLLVVVVLVQQQPLQQSWGLQRVLFVLDAVQAVAMHLQQQVRQALLLQACKGVSKGRQQKMNRQHHPCHACLVSSSGSSRSSSIRGQQQQEQQHVIRATQVIRSGPNSSRQEQAAAVVNGA
jgi:hypothetical protein